MSLEDLKDFAYNHLGINIQSVTTKTRALFEVISRMEAFVPTAVQ